MLINQSIKIVVILSLCLSLVSCEWNEFEADTTGIENVSFSNDIMPIFNQSCNSVGCHNNGGISPDLSPVNGFQDLIDENMIDLGNPANSELYVRMIDVQKPMPLSGVLSESVTKTVLVWIEEGALDN